jgi:hypothetical protein
MAGCDIKDFCKVYNRMYKSLDELRTQYNFCNNIKIPEESHKCPFYMPNFTKSKKIENLKMGVEAIL